MRHLRLLLLILVALAVPFQGALAVSAGQHAALEQCHHDGHDGHEGHGEQSASHCHECCAAAAIAGAIRTLPGSPAHDLTAVAPDLPPLTPPPSGIDRPPRTAL